MACFTRDAHPQAHGNFLFLSAFREPRWVYQSFTGHGFSPRFSMPVVHAPPNMALQRTRRSRVRSGRSLCSLGSPLEGRPFGVGGRMSRQYEVGAGVLAGGGWGRGGSAMNAGVQILRLAVG